MAAQSKLGVARVITEMVKGKEELDANTGKMVAGAVAKHFNLKQENVAILQLTKSGKQLHFIVPEKLSKIGSIPITSTRALAVRTLRDKRPEVINKFQAAEHHTVFEAVKLTKEGGGPIQKIISAPIMAGSKPSGVMQISRKGKSPGAAGPDFSPKDSKELSEICAALSSCLQPG
jgi:hypothetical protein